MSKVFVLNGVNLGTLGTRRPEVYGTMTLDDIERLCRTSFRTWTYEFRQTDYEGEMVGFIKGSGGFRRARHKRRCLDPLLLRPARRPGGPGCTEGRGSSVNVHAREEWRRESVVSPAVDAVVAGMGPHGYVAAVGYLLAGRGARGSEG